MSVLISMDKLANKHMLLLGDQTHGLGRQKPGAVTSAIYLFQQISLQKYFTFNTIHFLKNAIGNGMNMQNNIQCLSQNYLNEKVLMKYIKQKNSVYLLSMMLN